MTPTPIPRNCALGFQWRWIREEEAILREYKGHLTALTAGQQKDGRWMCQYLILDSGITGYCDGIFATHDEADAAAIQLAKYRIDSRQWESGGP